jgi:hypothetical protein
VPIGGGVDGADLGVGRHLGRTVPGGIGTLATRLKPPGDPRGFRASKHDARDPFMLEFRVYLLNTRFLTMSGYENLV